MLDFGNVVTAMVTPFDAQGKLDVEAVRKLAKHLENTGTDTILVAGTTGESPTLSCEEKITLLKTVKDVVKIPVMIGTGCNDTRATIEMSKMAEEAGADALLLVVPYYNKPNAKGLYEHFKAIAESTKLPCMLYNIPSRTGINMDAETTIELSKISNIIALKAASGCLDHIIRIRMATSGDFSIYSGDDSLTLPILSVGGRGVVSVASNIIGSPIQEMVSLYRKGESDKARARFFNLYPMFRGLFIDTNPIPVKYAASLLGLLEDNYRLPIVGPEEDTKQFVKQLLEKYKLL
ncbi:4-hydroxy-tetrahydrodipicolinate synthase [Clostridia bacterium]|nr:4-hydroxy-tetrahydrodipicolinate synthase [Clostridia bacterium]